MCGYLRERQESVREFNVKTPESISGHSRRKFNRISVANWLTITPILQYFDEYSLHSFGPDLNWLEENYLNQLAYIHLHKRGPEDSQNWFKYAWRGPDPESVNLNNHCDTCQHFTVFLSVCLKNFPRWQCWWCTTGSDTSLCSWVIDHWNDEPPLITFQTFLSSSAVMKNTRRQLIGYCLIRSTALRWPSSAALDWACSLTPWSVRTPSLILTYRASHRAQVLHTHIFIQI